MADGLTAERWTSTPVSGLVRRDLKLENILLTAGGDVKLSDFGLGAVREAAAESHLLHTVRRFSHRSPEPFLQCTRSSTAGLLTLCHHFAGVRHAQLRRPGGAAAEGVRGRLRRRLVPR